MFKKGKKTEAPMTDPYKWTGDEVCMFLDALNMGAYKQSFKTQEITGDILIDLGESDLFTLKITSASERAKLLLAIQQLKAKWGRQVDGKDEGSESQSSSSAISDHSGSTASSQKSASKEVMFKCHYGEENRMIKGHAPLTWEKVARKIRQAFGHRMIVKYVDKQGDLISVKTEEEFQTMIMEFGFGSTIKLQLDRKRKTNAVKDSDTAILETMLNPVVVIDAAGAIQFANTACSKMLGYSKKELVGANVRMLMNSAIADKHDGYISEYLRTGHAKIIGKGRVVEARRKDGTMIHVDLAVSHTKSHRRDVFTGTFSEVQRNAPASPTSAVAAAHSGDTALAGLSAGFALLENLLFAAVVADQRGNILFANSNAAKLFGYDKATLLGKNVRLLCPEPDASNHDSYMRQYIETRKPKVIGKSRNVVGMMKDGSLVPINLTLSEQILGSNNLIFTAVIRPLTEADQAGTAEAKSVMAAERDVVSTLPVPAVMIDERGLIQAFNEPAEQLWGYKVTEVVGRNVKMLMPSPDRDRHDAYIKKYLETGKHKVLGMGRDLVALHKDGSVLPVRLSVSEKRDGAKRIFTGIAQKLAT